MNEGMVREALHLVADGVDEYPVVERALRRARRARVARLVAVPVGLALMVLAVLVLVPAVSAPTVVASPPVTGLRLPDRVDAPAVLTPTIADAPPGPVPLVMAGSRYPLTGLLYASKAMTVNAAGHRAQEWTNSWRAMPGENLLLSPDGTRLAWLGTDGVHVVDLRTGEERVVAPGPFARSTAEPLAWSPDGTYLAYAEMPPGLGLIAGSPPMVGIGLLDVATGTARRVIETPDGTVPDSRPGLAFSPDGLRVAYESAGRLHVAALGGRDLWWVDLPPQGRIAGKAAWTPDGTAVALAVPMPCCGTTTADWALWFYDAATGERRPDPQYSVAADLTAIRLVGWTPAGEAVAVAFVAKDRSADLTSYISRTDFDLVRRAELVALAPNRPARVLLRAPDGVEALDVAELAVATEGVAAVPGPPLILVPSSWWAFGGGAVVVAQILIAFVAVAVMRARRHRSPLAVTRPDRGNGGPYRRTAP
jgi:hypothetical protein